MYSQDPQMSLLQKRKKNIPLWLVVSNDLSWRTCFVNSSYCLKSSFNRWEKSPTLNGLYLWRMTIDRLMMNCSYWLSGAENVLLYSWKWSEMRKSLTNYSLMNFFLSAFKITQFFSIFFISSNNFRRLTSCPQMAKSSPEISTESSGTWTHYHEFRIT